MRSFAIDRENRAKTPDGTFDLPAGVFASTEEFVAATNRMWARTGVPGKLKIIFNPKEKVVYDRGWRRP